MIKTVILAGKKVSILDQTLLPETEKYIDIPDYRAMIEAIKKLRIRGAPAIGVAGAIACALAYDEFSQVDVLEKSFLEIENSRPTAVNLSHAVNMVRDYLNRKKSTAISSEVWDLARDLMTKEKLYSDLQADNGVKEIYHGQDEIRILTHCNAGSLATYGEGTALSVIKALAKRCKVKVWADETRPLLQGARLTAWELVKSGVDVTVITDSMAAYTIKNKGIDLIITGADRITTNGDTANKIGTYGLSILAKHFKIPFYIVAPETTIDRTLDCGSKINIEERDFAELRFFNGKQIAPLECNVFNPAFDVVDNKDITAIITDKCVYHPPYKLG